MAEVFAVTGYIADDMVKNIATKTWADSRWIRISQPGSSESQAIQAKT